MRYTLLFLFLFITAATIGQPMKIMTYNIRLNTTADGPNHWPKRMEKVFELIRKYDPDIIGVQEALGDQLNDLISNLPAYGYVGVGRDDGKTKGEYSAILYKKDRLAVIDQNTFWLSETPTVAGSKGWDAAITRVSTWAIFNDKKVNKKFLMMNTHFDHIGKEARRNSAALLQKRAAELRKDLPVIISGDFNAQRDEPPFAAITSGDQLKLYDSRPKGVNQGTYCTFNVNGPECTAIDYIFYSDGWNVSDYEVITDNDGTYYPSDHLPVMVSVSRK